MKACTHLSITPPESPLRPLLGARESSSSKKMTQGAAERALRKTDGNPHHVQKYNIYLKMCSNLTLGDTFLGTRILFTVNAAKQKRTNRKRRQFVCFLK